MTDALSDEWIEEARGLLTGLAPAGDIDAVVQYGVTGGPNGRVTIGVVISGGRITDLVSGRVADPDCKVSLSHEMVNRLIDGTVDSDFAFMTGGLKVEGDHALWLIGLRDLRAAAIEALAAMPLAAMPSGA